MSTASFWIRTSSQAKHSPNRRAARSLRCREVTSIEANGPGFASISGFFEELPYHAMLQRRPGTPEFSRMLTVTRNQYVVD